MSSVLELRQCRAQSNTRATAAPESLLSIGAAAADHAERRLVQKMQEETGGNRKKAAQRLNICYKALLNKMKKWHGDAHFAAALGVNSLAAQPLQEDVTAPD